MKKQLFFVMLSIPLTVFSQSQVGDVKYSVLDPDTFVTLYPDWVPLNGQQIKPEWKIFNLVKFKDDKLPDARGVFIRVMNQQQDSSIGDPDNTRDIGSFQPDGIKKHKHGFSDAYFAEYGGGTGHMGCGKNDGDNPNRWQDSDETDTGTIDGKSLISETRPRNIVLYIYIKVN